MTRHHMGTAHATGSNTNVQFTYAAACSLNSHASTHDFCAHMHTNAMPAADIVRCKLI